MRLFIAVPLPGDVRRALSAYTRALTVRGATGRFVPEDNFHITLRFIGESGDLFGLTSAMRDAVRGARPFSLKTGALGSFSAGGGSTGYLGVTGEVFELTRLAETLEAALIERGFARGRGRFVPHITLARSLALPDGAPPAPAPMPFRADAIVLMESRREDGQMRYIPLHRELL